MCSLDVSLYGVMMSWGFYEFDELSFDEMTAFKYFSEGLFCDLFPEGNKLQLLFLSMECFILSNTPSGQK